MTGDIRHEFVALRAYKTPFLENLLRGLGFAPVPLSTLCGKSGLEHEFSAIGRREGSGHILGVMDTHDLSESLHGIPPVEAALRELTLRVHDVQLGLRDVDIVFDTLYFDNRFFYKLHGYRTYDERLALPTRKPQGFAWHSSDIESVTPLESMQAAHEVSYRLGTCFLSLNSLSIEEIALLTLQGTDTGTLSDVLTKHRVSQYFQSPTDELLLSMGRLQSGLTENNVANIRALVQDCRHSLSKNAVLTDVDHTDPVDVAVQLEKHKYLSYEAEVFRITSKGRIITERIRKTAQENFVIRLVRALDIPAAIKSIGELLK